MALAEELGLRRGRVLAKDIHELFLDDSKYREGYFDQMIEYLIGRFPYFSELAE